MEVKKDYNQAEMTVSVIGSLNTATAPELEQELQEIPEGIQKLIFDCAQMEYISSAGIRVIISTFTRIQKLQGQMLLRNLNEDVYEVFDMTGLTDVLTIEE